MLPVKSISRLTTTKTNKSATSRITRSEYSARIHSTRTLLDDQKANEKFIISSDDSETDGEEIELEKRYGEFEISTEYMQVSKFLKLAKFADQTGTVLALVALNDLVTGDGERLCTMKLGGVQLMVNLLKVADRRSTIGALKLLKNLVQHYFVVDEIIKLGGVHILLDMLAQYQAKYRQIAVSHHTPMILGVEVLITLLQSRRIRRLTRSCNGIAILVEFLTIDISKYFERLNTENSRRGEQNRTKRSAKKRKTSSLKSKVFDDLDTEDLVLLHTAATALWRCTENKTNVSSFLSYDVTQTLATLLSLHIREIDLPVLGLVNHCCVKESFCEEMLFYDLVYHCVRCLRHEHHSNMQKVAAETIAKCVKFSPVAREEIEVYGGMEALVRMIESNITGKTSQLEIALHALRMCLRDNQQNCNWFIDEGYVDMILSIIEITHGNQVAIHCFGILEEFISVDHENCIYALQRGVIDVLMENLQKVDDDVIQSVNQVIAIGAQTAEFRESLLSKDVLRLAWTNLRSDCSDTVASSADAVYSMVVEPLVIAETVRSFVGGLEILVKLLKSTDCKIASAIGHVISRIAEDPENQIVLANYGIVQIIVEQCKVRNGEVRKALCRCIARYSHVKKCQTTLKEVIRYLGTWLHSTDLSIKHETTHALYNLSNNEDNCILMYKCGVVKHLTALIRSEDENLQEEAAECVKNIRKTIMAA